MVQSVSGVNPKHSPTPLTYGYCSWISQIMLYQLRLFVQTLARATPARTSDLTEWTGQTGFYNNDIPFTIAVLQIAVRELLPLRTGIDRLLLTRSVCHVEVSWRDIKLSPRNPVLILWRKRFHYVKKSTVDRRLRDMPRDLEGFPQVFPLICVDLLSNGNSSLGY